VPETPFSRVCGAPAGGPSALPLRVLPSSRNTPRQPQPSNVFEDGLDLLLDAKGGTLPGPRTCSGPVRKKDRWTSGAPVKTGKELRMKESYRKDLASQPDPESCGGGREADAEALTGAHAGQPLSCEIKPFGVPTPSLEAEGNIEQGDTGESCPDPAQSKTLGMRGNSLHGNRETPRTPVAEVAAGRSEKASGRTSDLHVGGESDGSIVRAGQHADQAGWSPAGARMRGAISKGGGNSSSAGRVNTVNPKRARGWKRRRRPRGWTYVRAQLGTATGWQGVRREAESEGLAEQYRAVVKGAIPRTNRSAQGGARSSLHYGGEGVLIHPPHQGVCGRHGTEDLRVTPGGLMWSPGGAGVRDPISLWRSGKRCRMSRRTAE